MEATRPTPRMQLPFVILNGDGNQVPRVQYFRKSAEGKMLPLTHITVEESNYADPLGVKIKQLCEMYREKEAEVDGFLKRIDELETQVRLQEGEINSLAGKINELKGKRAKG